MHARVQVGVRVYECALSEYIRVGRFACICMHLCCFACLCACPLKEVGAGGRGSRWIARLWCGLFEHACVPFAQGASRDGRVWGFGGAGGPVQCGERGGTGFGETGEERFQVESGIPHIVEAAYVEKVTRLAMGVIVDDDGPYETVLRASAGCLEIYYRSLTCPCSPVIDPRAFLFGARCRWCEHFFRV